MDKLSLSQITVSACRTAVLGGYLKALLRLISTWQARRHNREFMAHIDPRLARDIGLTRRDLQREIAKPFWRQ